MEYQVPIPYHVLAVEYRIQYCSTRVFGRLVHCTEVSHIVLVVVLVSTVVPPQNSSNSDSMMNYRCSSSSVSVSRRAVYHLGGPRQQQSLWSRHLGSRVVDATQGMRIAAASMSSSSAALDFQCRRRIHGRAAWKGMTAGRSGSRSLSTDQSMQPTVQGQLEEIIRIATVIVESDYNQGGDIERDAARLLFATRASSFPPSRLIDAMKSDDAAVDHAEILYQAFLRITWKAVSHNALPVLALWLAERAHRFSFVFHGQLYQQLLTLAADEDQPSSSRMVELLDAAFRCTSKPLDPYYFGDALLKLVKRRCYDEAGNVLSALINEYDVLTLPLDITIDLLSGFEETLEGLDVEELDEMDHDPAALKLLAILDCLCHVDKSNKDTYTARNTHKGTLSEALDDLLEECLARASNGSTAIDTMTMDDDESDSSSSDHEQEWDDMSFAQSDPFLPADHVYSRDTNWDLPDVMDQLRALNNNKPVLYSREYETALVLQREEEFDLDENYKED
jgi:hypothetical protein